MNITIIKLKDTIFGQELKVAKEELNLLGELREDVKTIKDDFKNFEQKFDKLSEVANNNNDEIKKIEKKIGNLNDNCKKNFNSIYFFFLLLLLLIMLYYIVLFNSILFYFIL